MVEQGSEIVRDLGNSSARKAGRAAVPGPVGEQIAHAEIALYRRIWVPIEPASRRPLQAQDRDPVRFAPPPPGEGAAVAELQLAVLIADAIVGHRHGTHILT